jgi:hypothetical protein
MKLKSAAFVLVLAAAAAAPAAYARNDLLTFPIAPVMETADYKSNIGDFKFEFGGKAHGASLGSTTSQRPANGFGKKPEVACGRALLNTLIALKNDAIAHGGTSVQGITSGENFSSATEFQCTSGGTNARVHLVGTIVK